MNQYLLYHNFGSASDKLNGKEFHLPEINFPNENFYVSKENHGL